MIPAVDLAGGTSTAHIGIPETASDPERTAAVDRVDWIELGRVAAILAVIAIHVAASLVQRTSHPSAWWFGNLVESGSRWSVPLFVMISGALLLTSPRTADARAFYRRRFARLGPALIVWTIAYLIFGHITAGAPRRFEDAFRSVLAGRPFYHLYFLFVIAGLYVVAPALRLLFERVSRRSLMIMTALAFGLAIGDVAIQYLGGGGAPNALTRWLPFVGFFLAGAWLRDVASTPRRIRLAAGIALGGVIATAVGTALMVGPLGLGLGAGRYLYEYQSITTVPVSLAVFLLLVWLGPGLTHRLPATLRGLMSSVAICSFGIYLVHPMVLVGLGSLGVGMRMTVVPLAVLLTMALVFLGSWAIVALVRRVPGLRMLI